MAILYDILFLVFALLYLPVLIVKQKWHKDFLMRFGRFPAAVKDALLGVKNIWIHAVSVGEVAVVLRLIDGIKEEFPSYNIVISTVTQTGYALAESHSKDKFTVIYAPLDLSTIVKEFISVIRPKVYITAETELWPNMLSALKRENIPIVLINGRISDTSFHGYRAVRVFIESLLEGVRAFCMQSRQDSRRIITIGAPQEKVRVIGNMKFDNLAPIIKFDPSHLGLTDRELLFVAGSTHPGEEEILLDIFQNLSPEFPELRLMLAPRHPERTNEVVSLVKEYGLNPVTFSGISEKRLDKKSVVIVDTIGDLGSLYNLATLVFVGKSLTVGGGHNIVEPASCGKPILIGPHMCNFKDIVDIFLQEKAILQVEDQQALLSAVRDLLNDPDKLRHLGVLAKKTVEKHSGATTRTMEIISSVLRNA